MSISAFIMVYSNFNDFLSFVGGGGRDQHHSVYGYDRKDYGFLRVLTGRNRNHTDASGGSYGYSTMH